jgi:hypothetical protein
MPLRGPASPEALGALDLLCHIRGQGPLLQAWMNLQAWELVHGSGTLRAAHSLAQIEAVGF